MTADGDNAALTVHTTSAVLADSNQQDGIWTTRNNDFFTSMGLDEHPDTYLTLDPQRRAAPSPYETLEVKTASDVSASGGIKSPSVVDTVDGVGSDICGEQELVDGDAYESTEHVLARVSLVNEYEPLRAGNVERLTSSVNEELSDSSETAYVNVDDRYAYFDRSGYNHGKLKPRVTDLHAVAKVYTSKQ